MIKIICDKCGNEIKALSNKPSKEKGTGVGLGNQHLCAECIEKTLTAKKEA